MKLLQATVISSLLIGTSFSAQNISIVGTVSHTFNLPKVYPNQKIEARVRTPAITQEIKLLHIKLSDEEKQTLSSKAKDALEHTGQFALNALLHKANKYPDKVALGMNNVPVLNQGNHGSCVTFAITAAVDAALQKGDYISQLCQLQLGNYLANNGYGVSGWNGSPGTFVLAQMDRFGIVNKEHEASEGCGGLTQYPIGGEEPTTSINVEDFHRMSEPFSDYFNEDSAHQVVWSPLLNMYQTQEDRVDTNRTLADVKTALIVGDRVSFGVLFPAIDLGVVGAVGHHQTANDSWVLTPEIAREVYLKPLYTAHEMVITGYDDHAIAIDDHEQPHYGLLTLRNSWGDGIGNHGDFYMSYDYFKLLVIDAERIRSKSLAHHDQVYS